MGFNYNPKDAVQCLPEGDYDATIVSAEEAKAKTGADMIVVKYRVYKPDGGEMPFTDRIVLPKFAFKLKRLAKAVGAADRFDAGTLDPGDLEGENVRLTLTIQEQDGYEPQNQVKTIEASSMAAKVLPKHAPMGEEDIPF